MPTKLGTPKSHGATVLGVRTPEYRAWRNMINRCTNPNYEKWHRYGGRGIRVCQAWLDSFEQFLADVGHRPGPGYSLDRKENDGNYEPGNVKWSTNKQQARNGRRSKLIEFRGEIKTLAEWAEVLDVKYHTLYHRITVQKQDFGFAVSDMKERGPGRGRRGTSKHY